MTIWHSLGGFGIIVGGICVLTLLIWGYLRLYVKFLTDDDIKRVRDLTDDHIDSAFAIASMLLLVITALTVASYYLGKLVFG